MTDHQNAIEQAKSLLKGQHDLIANAANISAPLLKPGKCKGLPMCTLSRVILHATYHHVPKS
jgi:hypothetical protein